MTSKNIGYHTRLTSDGSKVVGGSFGGSLDMETVNRLVKAHFTVTVKPSGHTVFVDKAGREVRLYFAIDASQTEAGKQALATWRNKQRQEAEVQEQQADEISQLLDSLTPEEIIKRLQRED